MRVLALLITLFVSCSSLRLPRVTRASLVRLQYLAVFSQPPGASGNEDELQAKIPAKFITASDASAPQGYLNSDMSKMGDGKQSRVAAYIALALVPCLFLVPFFLSRDFVPPTID